MGADSRPADEDFSARFTPVVEFTNLSVQLVCVQIPHDLVANFTLFPVFQLTRGQFA